MADIMTYRPSRTAVVSVLLAFGLPVTAWLLSADLRDAVGRAIAILTTADIDAAIAALIDYLRSFGIWAPVVSAALMVLQSVAAPIPAFLLTFANGMLFGWFWGAALSWLSAMAGAALCFWLARVLGRPAVERLAGGGAVLSTTDRFFERFGTHSILVARLLPFVSFDVVSYAAGL
ncbi:MAG TPA: VTT domain-containing protein, partial [Hyphomonas sp.]|nr:VTT domain-containing protein [Hyphomonas sp.]